ncbi:probable cytosolic oligopeptidase A isoform X3 [Hyalella azteca]|uniref:oligopeptidase A n=1 Tax=Hyalella azteca TaxID=294128 RepID=A0A8B7NX37_HYAAZ|nr:probable cytosolic oligopeptidase A isoform X3 [Hyalella azteca]
MLQTTLLKGLRRLCLPRLQPCCHMSYVVLLPEDPVDTAENNALLRTAHGDLPNFEEITGEKCHAGVGKLALDLETGVWEIEEKIRDKPKSVSFDTVLKPLDALDAQLNFGWSTAKVLYIARQDKLPQKTYLGLHERARKARVQKFQSLPIYKACKVISEQEAPSLDSNKRRVLQKFLLESRLNGMDLSPTKADQFLSIINKLDQKKQQYRQKVQVSTSRFAYEITDPNIVQHFPPHLLERMSPSGDTTRGPWHVTLKSDVYEGFMAHCSKRALRWNTWQAYNMRATRFIDPQLDNSVNIEEIRASRNDLARILGYSNFATMSMETKMAGSVENVLSLITSLMAKAVPKQAEEIASLTAFAKERDFSEDALQAYDVPYYSRLQRQHLYGEGEKLRQFFPLDHVLTALLQLSAELFAVQFEELAPGPELKAWHPSVRLFNVLEEDGAPIASFYFDPYRRPGEKLEPTSGSGWFASLRSRSTLSDRPVAALVFNFPPPGSDAQHDSDETLLTVSDVVTLFSKFGEALQHMLTTVPYGEVSGLTNIEWDAMALTQHFMANWVFVPEVLSSLGRHYDTGAPLPPDVIADIISSHNHMAAHNLSKHLYLANLDLLLHTTKDFWKSIMTGLWPQFLPYELDKKDYHPCSFTASMCDVWAAAYYSHTWARVMAADCTKSFIDDERSHWRSTGLRFRSTFLSLGGGEAPAEVFRKFRGRDPSPDALIELYGIGGAK